MWFPFVGVPQWVEQGMEGYREIFCRSAGFAHSRYVTGLLRSANVWLEGEERSRRAMQAAVFEAGWDSEGLLARHRAVVSGCHRGQS